MSKHKHVTQFDDETEDTSTTPAEFASAGYGIPVRGIVPVTRTANLPNSLTRQDDGTYKFRGFTLSGVGLHAPTDLQPADWHALGKVLGDLNSNYNWWVGDWINNVPREWGEMYEDAARLTGLAYESLRNIASVCGQVELSFRNDKLSFTHHVVIAPMSPEKQRLWLERAALNKWSVARLRREIEAANKGGNDDPVEFDPFVDRAHRRRFNRLWKTLEVGKPSLEDAKTLREWLTTIINTYSPNTADREGNE